MNRYNYAREQYGALGVNTDEVVAKLSNVKISMHCWQGDDVCGFEQTGSLSGGIAATGNYPGKARDIKELMQDIDMAFSLIPGKHRLNLHAIYAAEQVQRNQIKPKHFEPWVEFAGERGLGLDFNPTLFSHPKADDGFTLSSEDNDIRQFWIEHCMATREIAAYFGKTLKSASLHNIWIPDGFKNSPPCRLKARQRLLESLDTNFRVSYHKEYLLDSLESKVFGIGLESCTVGSHEFYLNYALKHGILYLLDNGHFHPTENVADKFSSLLLYFDKLALHVTRPVRWDSDHVVVLDDTLLEIAKEIVSCGALEKVMIGLDYFDASINRIAAWIIGMRNMQKALLYVLLMPWNKLVSLQEKGDFTAVMALEEELKTYPFGDVWDEFLNRNQTSKNWFNAVKEYENNVLSKRIS